MHQSRTFDQQLQTIFTPTPIQLHRITVEKTSATADFGFSLSDGMYEKGVYVSAVRTGSPAQRAGVRAFDRILQVCLGPHCLSACLFICVPLLESLSSPNIG